MRPDARRPCAACEAMWGQFERHAPAAVEAALKGGPPRAG